MGQDDQYEIYLRRSMECEALARSASDISIREKCAELAVAYRALADEMQLSMHSKAIEVEQADTSGHMMA